MAELREEAESGHKFTWHVIWKPKGEVKIPVKVFYHRGWSPFPGFLPLPSATGLQGERLPSLPVIVIRIGTYFRGGHHYPDHMRGTWRHT